jgi:hypothetical protein
MPKQNTILQVFVASPSDVAEERATLDQIISELNLIYSKSINISFELIKWENDITPGFASEPQAVINKQIPDDYDVFIGIFWSRIGTPTKFYASGSIEEFNTALSRFKKSGAPQIMIYFKEEPIPPANINIDQFAKLLEFRNSISSEGGLYSTFKDISNFEASLRTHLSTLAQNATTQNPAPPMDTTSEAGESFYEEELGYLDYVDIHTQRMSGMSECLISITKLMEKYTEKTSQNTWEIKHSHADPARTRRLMNTQAENMASFASEITPLIARYATHKELAFEALSKAISLHHEIGGSSTQLNELKSTLSNFLDTAIDAKSSTESMYNTAANFPRLTKELNFGKRKLVDSFSKFIYEISDTISMTKNILDSISKLN